MRTCHRGIDLIEKWHTPQLDFGLEKSGYFFAQALDYQISTLKVQTISLPKTVMDLRLTCYAPIQKSLLQTYDKDIFQPISQFEVLQQFSHQLKQQSSAKILHPRKKCKKILMRFLSVFCETKRIFNKNAYNGKICTIDYKKQFYMINMLHTCRPDFNCPVIFLKPPSQWAQQQLAQRLLSVKQKIAKNLPVI